MLSRADKDYYQQLGLGKRLDLPKDLSILRAKEIKLKT